MKALLNILLPILLAVHAAASTKRPNILFIFADDIGYEALGCYGGLDFETPRLDRMAAEGIRFDRAYTHPACTPSRVSLHTGLYATRHQRYSILPVHLGTKAIIDFREKPTFAQQIRANGYHTATTGKWQLATIEYHPDHIRESGFDSWCIWQIWHDGEKTDRHWDATLNHDGGIRDDIADRFGPDVIADYVIDEMRIATEAGKPFLIVHNELLPHWPVVDTPDDRALDREPSLVNFIHYMDKLVGRLLDAVEELGIRDNTYVLFMGDNGTWPPDFENPRFGQSGEGPHTRHTTEGRVDGGKPELNDAGCHVPLIAWGPPAIAEGSENDELIDIVDLFPTFMELTGTEMPESLAIDGRSIVPQLHGEPGIHRPWTHNAYVERFGGETLFDGNFRLFRASGRLIDARNLPEEKEAEPDDPEATAAKAVLRAVFDKLTPDGPRPPVPFEPVGE